MAEEQKPQTPPAPEQKPATQATPDASAVEKRIADAEARARKAEDDLAAAGKKASDDKLLEEGKLKELLAQRDKELEALKADAGLGKSFREREQKRIDDAKAKLTESQQKLLDLVPTLDGKSALLDELLGKSGTPAATEPKKGEPPPKNQGGAAAANSIDFDEAYRDPVKWADAKKRDPKGADEWFAAALKGGARGRPAPKPLAFLHTPSNTQ